MNSTPIEGSDCLPLQKIVFFLKKSLNDSTMSKINGLITEHYLCLQLKKESNCWGNHLWSNEKFENIEEWLQPKNMTIADLEEFIDSIAENVKKNPYLMNFLQMDFETSDLNNFYETLEQESHRFPDLITYAFVLDRLNSAIIQDFKIYEACKEVWYASYIRKLLKIKNVFKIVKFLTLRRAISIKINQLRTKHVPPESGSQGLPLNIYEAMLDDQRQGNLDNAMVASVLAQNSPGRLEYDSKSQAGPTILAKDGNTIEYNFPFPKEWADLYSTWNLAFVMKFPGFPYYMVKLLIPSVSGYANNPTGYIYSRSTALTAHANFVLNSKLNDMNWYCDTELIKKWGQSNYSGMQHYLSLFSDDDEKNTLSYVLKKKNPSKLTMLKWFINYT